jgi:PAS domain S-box-containing protein
MNGAAIIERERQTAEELLGGSPLVILQSLLAIVLSYQMLFSPESNLSREGKELFVVVLLGSVAAVKFLPAPVVWHRFFSMSLILLDTLLTTLVIYLSGHAETDMFLAYFLIILIGASSRSLRGKLLVSALLSLAYGTIVVLQMSEREMFLEGHLLRVPILLVTGLFFGVLSEQLVAARRESDTLIDALAEHRRAEQMIRESEEQFRKTFEDAPIGVVLVAPDFHYLRANKSFCGLVGYSESELREKTFLDITHPDDVERDRQLAEQVMKGEISRYELEKRYVTKERGIVWIHLVATVARDVDGKVSYGIGMVQDITAIKKARQYELVQLAVSGILAESRSLVEAAPKLLQAIGENTGWDLARLWRVESAGNRLVCESTWQNPARDIAPVLSSSRGLTFSSSPGHARRIWGSKGAVWVTDVSTDRDFRSLGKIASAGLRGGVAVPIRVGTEQFGIIELFSRQAGEPDQDLENMMADVGIKIAQFARRWQAEESAKVSEERFNLAINYANEAILCLDRSSVVIWANRQAEVITGRSAADLVGMSLMQAFGAHPLAKSQLAAIGAGKDVPPLIEFEAFLRDGRSLLLEVNVTQVEKDGEAVGWLLVARDRTERKLLEQRLRETEKLAALGTVVDRVANELNDPLFTISGLTQLANEKIALREFEGLPQDLRAIYAAAQKAKDLVQRTLEVAQSPRKGKHKCHVNDLVRQAVALVEQDCAAHRIAVQAQLQEGPLHVIADPYDVKLVLLNLFANARKAMAAAHGQGTMTVTTALLPLESKPWVEVRVGDDGPGLTPDEQAKLFKPLAVAAPDASSGPTGLGLSVFRQIVHDAGGALLCESEPGRGTTFIVRLPAVAS